MCEYFLILSEPAKKCQYLFVMFPSVLMEQSIISGPVPLDYCFVFIGGVGSGCCVCVCVCVCACVHTHAYTQSAQLHPTLCFPGEPIAHQAPLFMEFSRQEYWSGLPFSSPEDLPNLSLHCRKILCHLNHNWTILYNGLRLAFFFFFFKKNY